LARLWRFPSPLPLLGLLLLRLLGPLLLLLLSGLSAPLLRLIPLWLFPSPLLLLRLFLRALLLCGWRRSLLPPALLLFRLALFFVLPVLLRVRGDNRPEKQKQNSGICNSTELHSNCLH
jgi:hypothetical protein